MKMKQRKWRLGVYANGGGFLFLYECRDIQFQDFFCSHMPFYRSITCCFHPESVRATTNSIKCTQSDFLLPLGKLLLFDVQELDLQCLKNKHAVSVSGIF